MGLNLSINDWDDIFTEMAIESPHVFWLRSLDYKEHIFHSKSFVTLWEADDQLFYHQPQAFNDYLISDNRDELIQTWSSRHDTIGKGVAYYKIKTADGKGKYIKDHYTTLFNEKGEPLAAAGLAMQVSDTVHLQQKHLHDSYKKILKEKLNIIASDKGNPFKTSAPKLSRREQQCVYHLLQNRTAQQTADILYISRRTVEKHLENIKIKFECGNKVELLQKLMNQKI